MIIWCYTGQLVIAPDGNTCLSLIAKGSEAVQPFMQVGESTVEAEMRILGDDHLLSDRLLLEGLYNASAKAMMQKLRNTDWNVGEHPAAFVSILRRLYELLSHDAHYLRSMITRWIHNTDSLADVDPEPDLIDMVRKEDLATLAGIGSADVAANKDGSEEDWNRLIGDSLN